MSEHYALHWRNKRGLRATRSPLHPLSLSALLLAALVCPPACGGTSVAPPDPAAPVVAVSTAGHAATNTPTTARAAAKATPAFDISTLSGGLWRAAGEDDAAGHWHLSYRFDGDRYTTDGYPVWQESGRVRLLVADGRRLQLHFSDRIFDGNPDTPVDRWIVVAEDHQSFTMNGIVFVKRPHAATVAAAPDAEDPATVIDAPDDDG